MRLLQLRRVSARQGIKAVKLIDEQRRQAARNAGRATQQYFRQRREQPSIDWDACIANLKAMLNHLDRKYRQ